MDLKEPVDALFSCKTCKGNGHYWKSSGSHGLPGYIGGSRQEYYDCYDCGGTGYRPTEDKKCSLCLQPVDVAYVMGRHKCPAKEPVLG